MEKPKNNADFKAVGLHATGFSLLKAQSDGNFLLENHKNASFTTLLRECGIFFGEGPQSVRMVVTPAPPILIPNEIFAPPASQFFKIQSDLSDNDTIFEDEVGDYTALYTFNSGKIEQLRQAGITPFFQHSATVLARYLTLNSSNANRMTLFFHGNTAECVLFCYNRLSYVGAFEFSTNDEVVYHVANILRQHEVEADDCLLLFSGELPEPKKTFDFVNQYFPDMDWAGDRLPVTVTNTAGKSVAAHTVLNLLPF